MTLAKMVDDFRISELVTLAPGLAGSGMKINNSKIAASFRFKTANLNFFKNSPNAPTFQTFK